MSNEKTSTGPTSRVPAGVPTGGQFAASAKAEAAVTLGTGTTVGPDFAARFRPQIDAVEKRWRDEADTEDVFNTQIAALAQQMLDASEDDRPGYTKLDEALTWFREQMADPNADADDVAEEVIYCMQDVTEPTNMEVAYDSESGQYLRVADGQPGHTCGHCGAGYATASVLAVHKDTACEGLDDYENDIAHDALHSAAESFASDINATGRAEQVAFLRRSRVSDDEIQDAFTAHQPDASDGALDDLVIDTASQTASQAYNNGETDGRVVTEALEGARWGAATGRPLSTKSSWALGDGESKDVSTGTDIGRITFRVSYDEETLDNGLVRGTYSAESEWDTYAAPSIVTTVPFRPDKGGRAQATTRAWDNFSVRLMEAARDGARQHARDPLRSFIDGTD